MRHLYAHPAQQYHYPYSAYAVGILSDDELQAEIIKIIREQPTEYTAAYVQLPILVSQYGLPKDRAHTIISSLSNHEPHDVESSKNEGMKYFLSQMDVIKPVPTPSQKQDTPPESNAPTLDEAKYDRPKLKPTNNTQEDPEKQHFKKQASETTECNTETKVHEKEGLTQSIELKHNPSIQKESTQTDSDNFINNDNLDNNEPTAISAHNPLPSAQQDSYFTEEHTVSSTPSSIEPIPAAQTEDIKHSEKQGQDLSDLKARLTENFFRKKQFENRAIALQRRRRLIASVFLALLIGISFSYFGFHFRQGDTPNEEIPTIAATPPDNDTVSSIENTQTILETQESTTETVDLTDQKISEWYEKGSQLAKKFHIGPKEEPERALYYLDLIQQESTGHTLAAKLLQDIAEACRQWGEKILIDNNDTERHRIYLLRAERYEREAKRISAS